MEQQKETEEQDRDSPPEDRFQRISLALLQSKRNIQDWRVWRQTLICMKWHVPITRLSMWRQGPIAEIRAKGQAKDESRIWFRDGF